MSCDLNRSISVGFLTSIIISLISYFNIKVVRELDTTKLLFLFVVFFVIATSMDYFNYCRTKCNNLGSSLIYGIFTVSLIYIFYGLFVKDLNLNNNFIILISGNVILLTILHYILCNIRNIK